MLKLVELDEVSGIAHAKLALVEGINVFIGGNATCKSHAMKAAYALVKGASETAREPTLRQPRILSKLAGVFRPVDGDVRRLVRRRPGKSVGKVRLVEQGGGELSVSIHTSGAKIVKLSAKSWRGEGDAVFLPSREVLSMYEGFLDAYKRRELSFDETYYDACIAVGASQLRGSKPGWIGDVLERLQQELGGRVLFEGGRFYVRSSSGKLEAHLVSEGMRKVATLLQLVANGSLKNRDLIFWDEPEANLNPELVSTMTDVLVLLARAGVQMVLTTHDYLLSSKLSVEAEHGGGRPPVRFFGFSRAAGRGVEVVAGDTLADLPDNPIVREFANHYSWSKRRALGAGA